MEKKRIFNLIILDASGSMSSIYEQALGGVNETIATIRIAQEKHPELEQHLTLVSFSEDLNIIYKTTPISLVRDITRADYPLLGCTALYDAMGQSISALQESKKHSDCALVTIITDGYENASHKWTGPQIKSIVTELRQMGWTFNYIGANQDVEKVAGEIGVSNTMKFDASPEGTSAMFKGYACCSEKFYDRVVCAKECCEEDLKFFIPTPDSK